MRAGPAAWRRASLVVAAGLVAGTLSACGGSSGGPSTFSASELPRAQAFLARLKPPPGFRRETKTCLKGPTTRCFTSGRVVRPLTPSSLLATIRQFGIKPDPSQSRCERRRRRAGRPLVHCDGFGTLGGYNGGYAAWSSPSARRKLAGTRIALTISSVTR